jgi:hypothetical protein
VTTRLNDEIKAKDEVKQQLAEMKVQLDAELKAGGDNARAELKKIPLFKKTRETIGTGEGVDIQPNLRKLTEY